MTKEKEKEKKEKKGEDDQQEDLAPAHVDGKNYVRAPQRDPELDSSLSSIIIDEDQTKKVEVDDSFGGEIIEEPSVESLDPSLLALHVDQESGSDSDGTEDEGDKSALEGKIIDRSFDILAALDKLQRQYAVLAKNNGKLTEQLEAERKKNNTSTHPLEIKKELVASAPSTSSSSSSSSMQSSAASTIASVHLVPPTPAVKLTPEPLINLNQGAPVLQPTPSFAAESQGLELSPAASLSSQAELVRIVVAETLRTTLQSLSLSPVATQLRRFEPSDKPEDYVDFARRSMALWPHYIPEHEKIKVFCEATANAWDSQYCADPSQLENVLQSFIRFQKDVEVSCNPLVRLKNLRLQFAVGFGPFALEVRSIIQQLKASGTMIPDEILLGCVRDCLIKLENKFAKCNTVEEILAHGLVLQHRGALFDPIVRQAPKNQHQAPTSESSSPNQKNPHQGYGQGQGQGQGQRRYRHWKDQNRNERSVNAVEANDQTVCDTYGVSSVASNKPNHSPYFCLVDCGACSSFIDSKLVRSLNLETRPYFGPHFRAANSSEIHITAVAKVPVSFENKTVIVEMLTTSNLSVDVILGMDFLRPNKAVIDLGDLSIKLADGAHCKMVTLAEHRSFQPIMDRKFQTRNDRWPKSNGVHSIQQNESPITTAEELSEVTETEIGTPTATDPSDDKSSFDEVDDSFEQQHVIEDEWEFESTSNTEDETEWIPDREAMEEASRALDEAHEKAELTEPSNYSVNTICAVLSEAGMPSSGWEEDDDLTEAFFFPKLNADVTEVLKIDPDNICNTTQRKKIEKVILDYASAWSLTKTDIGQRPIGEIRLFLKETKPVWITHKGRRYAAIELDAIDEIIKEYLEMGVIELSKSNYSAPILLVKKKNGSFRLVVDYRALNAITEKTEFPMPRADDIYRRLGGSKFFSVIDCRSGFSQIEINVKDRHKTAFSTPNGIRYQFKRMPFGLTNGPAVFQRAMIDLLAGLEDIVFCFVDDLIVHNSTFFGHLEALRRVLQRLESCHVKLNAEKSTICTNQIKFLGNIVSADGLKPDPEKVQALAEMRRPANLHEVRSLLGGINYLRPFVPNCSIECGPISDLTLNGAKFEWTDSQEQAFRKIIEVLSSDVILSFPDTDRKVPFELHVDSSKQGVGAILIQKGRPVWYASVRLNVHQKRYAPTTLEAYGLYWSLKKMRHFILGHPLIVYTDHIALKDIDPGRTTNATLARWFAEIITYDPEIRYRKGAQMAHADMFSRLINSVSVDGDADKERIQLEQTNDDYCQQVKSSHKNYQLNDGLICVNEKGHQRVVVPVSLRQTVINKTHCSSTGAAHRGFKTTYEWVRDHYYWPRLKADVKAITSSCVACQRRKSPKLGQLGLMIPTRVSTAWDRIAIDLIGPITKTASGNSLILSVIDMFTKYAIAMALKDQKAETIADALFKSVFTKFGLPKEILSDEGTNLKGHVVQKLCDKFGVKRLFSSAHHPQANGQVERFNQIIGDTLALTYNERKNDWDEHLDAVTFAYNMTVQESTGMAPQELLFVRKPITPLQLDLGINLDLDREAPSLPERLKLITEMAQDRLERARAKQAASYNKGRHAEIPYEEGQLIMMRNFDSTRSTNNKFADRWRGPYKIFKMSNEQQTCEVRYLFGNSKKSLSANIANIKPFTELDTEVMTVLDQKEWIELRKTLKRLKSSMGNLKKKGMLNTDDSLTPVDQQSSDTSKNDEPNDVYEVEKVLVYRKVNDDRELFIKWKNYDEYAWVSAKNCKFKELVDDFFSSKALRRLFL